MIGMDRRVSEQQFHDRQAAERVRPVRLDFKFQPTWINLITLGEIPTLPFVEQLAQRLREDG